MIDQHIIVRISCNLLSLFSSQSIRIRNNTYSPQVQTIRIETGINSGITRFVLYGMKTTCLFKQFNLLIGNILQIAIPQRINPYCRPLTMINILPIIHTA